MSSRSVFQTRSSTVTRYYPFCSLDVLTNRAEGRCKNVSHSASLSPPHSVSLRKRKSFCLSIASLRQRNGILLYPPPPSIQVSPLLLSLMFQMARALLRQHRLGFPECRHSMRTAIYKRSAMSIRVTTPEQSHLWMLMLQPGQPGLQDLHRKASFSMKRL
jgi:hypothetical protein